MRAHVSCKTYRLALCDPNVRFGSKAACLRDVRFASQSDIRGYGPNVCFVQKADIRVIELAKPTTQF